MRRWRPINHDLTWVALRDTARSARSPQPSHSAATVASIQIRSAWPTHPSDDIGLCGATDEVRLAARAGFIYPLAGEMRTMPGLPSHPAGEKVDIDDSGKAVGLF